MEMILGPNAGEPVDLGAAYPWPDGRRWIRAMMVVTLDGASVGAGGLSGAISSAGDKKVFAQTRRLADAVLIGAGTMRAERYKPLTGTKESRADRAAAGLAPSPRLVLVSASLDLPWDDVVFSESEIQPLVVTAEACDAAALAVARKHADVAVLPGKKVDAAQLADHLESIGLLRITCEGGPHLLSDLAHAGVVDEADITISPLIVGGGQKVTGSPMDDPERFTLAHSIEDDEFLFNRYVAQ